MNVEGREEKRFDIESFNRFCCENNQIIRVITKTKIGSHITSRIIRSGTAPAPDYGEAQGKVVKASYNAGVFISHI